nr:MAG TPA: hypothetical protein [Caudoviricetes sp.]
MLASPRRNTRKKINRAKSVDAQRANTEVTYQIANGWQAP